LVRNVLTVRRQAVPDATVTSKGQITIPAQVRRDLGLRPGSRVSFVQMDNGAYEIIAKTESITRLKGIIPPLDRPVTIEEMNEAIAEGFSR
jgi:antitoxin PrlF